MFKFDRLKALRNARNLSQARVATHLNISREAYSMYETGKRQPSNELMIDMARFFNVSLDYLIGLA